jgi:glutamine---fructose-6-phosphate transaminase (isomerizing)
MPPSPVGWLTRCGSLRSDVPWGGHGDTTADHDSGRRCDHVGLMDWESALVDGIVPREIHEGPAAIRGTVDSTVELARSIADRVGRRFPGRIWVIGNGTSYHTSLYTAGLARRLSGPEDPVTIAMTAGEFRAFRPRLGADDVLIGISASGEFRDVISVVRDVRGQVPTIGVVHVPASTLAQLADHVVVSGGGPSSVPVMTKTFSATLAASALVVTALVHGPLSEVAAGLRQAADDAEAAITAASPLLGDLTAELASFEHIFVAGSGLALPAALEAALKLKEMAIVHAEASETWEMMSGASTIVGPGTAVIALTSEGPGRKDTANVVRNCESWGAGLIVEVATEQSTSAARHLPIPRSVDDTYAPLVTVPPVAMLAYLLARHRGEDPDRPRWVVRYHEQGLRHIVGV